MDLPKIIFCESYLKLPFSNVIVRVGRYVQNQVERGYFLGNSISRLIASDLLIWSNYLFRVTKLTATVKSNRSYFDLTSLNNIQSFEIENGAICCFLFGILNNTPERVQAI